MRRQILSRSYDHFFAEFLQELSHVHLGALTPTHLCRFTVRTHSTHISKTFPGRALTRLSADEADCRGTPHEQKSDNSPELLLFVILKKHGTRGRNINLLSIPSPYSGARLGPPNPWMIIIAKETLGFRCGRLSLPLRLLMPTFSLLIAPPNLPVKLHS
jgi:hypothetical protein